MSNEKKDYIGFDPVRWAERLRDVNAGSQFDARDKATIEQHLKDLEDKLNGSRGSF